MMDDHPCDDPRCQDHFEALITERDVLLAEIERLRRCELALRRAINTLIELRDLPLADFELRRDEIDEMVAAGKAELERVLADIARRE
jgi:hypothetical protein